MTKNDVNSYIGEIGVYQWRVFLVACVLNVFGADVIQIVFVGARMPHWCRVPELKDLPYDVQKHVAIPAQSINRDGDVKYSSCEMFSVNYSAVKFAGHEGWNRTELISNGTSVVRCSEWTYDRRQFHSTIVSKFNLVCGSEYLVPLASTAFIAGILLGAVSSGLLSDWIGRKRTALISFSVKFVGIFMSIFAPRYSVFAVGRFLVGLAAPGCAMTAYVILMELIGRSYRTAFSTAINISFAVGLMLQPAISYWLRDQFWYQVAATAPNLLCPFLVLFLMPESVRWLAVRGRYNDVTMLLQRICRTNGRKLPEDFNAANLIDEPTRPRRCSALLTSPVIRVRSLILDFNWLTCTLVHYAILLNIGELHGNIHLNALILASVDIPALVAAIFLMQWKVLGRRWTGCIAFLSAAGFSFLSLPLTLLEYQSASVATLMIGKAFIGINFAVVHVLGNELFPTEVRNAAIGSASTCARISSMGAAYIGGPLASVWKPLPSVVFGVFSAVAGLLCVFLPETLGTVLPDTIEEVEQQVRGRRRQQALESWSVDDERVAWNNGAGSRADACDGKITSSGDVDGPPSDLTLTVTAKI